MKKYLVDGHEPSILPDNRKFKLVWADEFDGKELDKTKWNFRLNFWGKPAEAYTDKGIVFDGKSNIELHRVEKDGYYVSPQLQTGSLSFDFPLKKEREGEGFWPFINFPELQFVHRFGYYECRCKFQKYPGEMWSAFWTQSPSIGIRHDARWCGVESDIMECFETGKITTGNIFGGYNENNGSEGRVNGIELEKTEDDYHRFGMLWTPTEYVFYTDGKETSRVNKTISQVPQFILLTTEVQGYRRGTPLKVEGEFVDDAFIADYVRVFDEI